MLLCESEGNADKTAVYTAGIPMKGAAKDCSGREVVVKILHANTKVNPTFTYNNITGPIKFFNKYDGDVSDSLCSANSFVVMMWNGEVWLADGFAITMKVVNNLDSDDEKTHLAAKQGKVLKASIDTLNASESVEGSVDNKIKKTFQITQAKIGDCTVESNDTDF